MTRYRNALPQLGTGMFLTDGGIETTLIFQDGLELPDFAAFHLLRDSEGEKALLRYFRSYAAIAREMRAGLVLESATWRASTDWGKRLGYTASELAEVNRRAIQLVENVRRECEADGVTTVVSGCVGPRGDGYVPGARMSAKDAAAYHNDQIRTFATTSADMICAMTMNYPEEAIGIARAARSAGMPVAISFTVEIDGRLPTGDSLRAAIEAVDDATSGAPAYYMINCAHPSHFAHVLREDGGIAKRIRGIRANASRKSHAELNQSPTLDIGEPDELGSDYVALKKLADRLNILGGCCGTDGRHIQAIARACRPLFAGSAGRSSVV